MVRRTRVPFLEAHIPSLRQFQYFVSIVDLGSMTRAAEQLYVAQPALGSQMRQLEQELGTTLLHRHSRGVTATPAGEVLYERARQILDLVSRTVQDIAALQADQKETLTLGMSPSVVHLAASDMLARAHAAMPNVMLRLVEETSSVLLDALKRGELDMLLAHEVPDTPGLTRSPWLQEQLLFVTANESGAQTVSTSSDITETITLSHVLQSQLTLPLRHDGVRHIIESAARPLGLQPHVAFQVQSPQALKILIADHAVASILPYGLAFPELRTGMLKAHRIVDPPLTRTLYMIRTERRFSEANEQGLAELLASIQERLFEQLGPLASPIEADHLSGIPQSQA